MYRIIKSGVGRDGSTVITSDIQTVTRTDCPSICTKESGVRRDGRAALVYQEPEIHRVDPEFGSTLKLL